MKKEEIGEYLYRFYRKRSSSFLANIYKASITMDSRDIHRARLDVKKIYALYGLFEMVDPEAFRKQPGYKLFRPLFRQAGKIREAQVNLLLLSDPVYDGPVFDALKAWISERDRKSVRNFLSYVKEFKEKEMKVSDQEIGKICRSGSVYRLRSKTTAYLRDNAEYIHILLAGSPGERELHRVRQHLKAMSTIATLVYSVKATRKLDNILTALNKTEMMIGNWHDQVVLKETINNYLAVIENIPEVEEGALLQSIQKLEDNNNNLVLHFIPEVDAVTGMILAEEE